MEIVHRSVMTSEVLEFLEPEPGDRLMIDATVGEGGHSASFLQRFPELRVTGLDADAVMLERARERLEGYKERVTLVHDWFDNYMTAQAEQGGVHAHRILVDLGVSMYHFMNAQRGFSYSGDEPLDMRLDASGSDRLPSDTATAADIVNTSDESDLADLIFMYGEERLSRRIAAAICRERDHRSIQTTGQLSEIIRKSVPASYRHGRINPATRTFQALRIAVNRELDRLTAMIPSALSLLGHGGRLGIISFHSLEDRIVKHTFRSSAADSNFRVMTKKPLVASESERVSNPASRSAKFRVIERLPVGPTERAGA